ncbi:MAG: cytochrome c biogenesis protein CcsA [Myxococcota bacterium]|nr:cytochrome c biogenesis protein CcsA [Myxococcota bacterium]
MAQLIEILGPLLPILYGSAFAAYLLIFLKELRSVQRLATPILVGASLMHLLYLILRALVFQHHPMAGGFELLSSISFSLGLAYLTIERWRKNRSTGLFVLPFVFGLQLISSVGIEPTYNINPILRDPWFGFHTGSAALGYAGFFLSAVYGVMYHVFHRALRRKTFGLVFERLPSLDILARMTYGAAVFGFIFLAVSIVSGMGWAAQAIPGNYWLDIKVLVTIGVWAFYGLALASPYVLRFKGRLLVSTLLLGFAFLLVSTLVVNFFLPGWHRFGVQ